MKTGVLFSLIATAAVAHVSADELSPQAGYASVDEVLEYGRKYQTIKSHLTDAGYRFHSCNQQVIYYFVTPMQAEYLYAQAECTYSTPSGGNFSLQTDYATVKIDVTFNQEHGVYREGDVTVNYTTVY
ncbi:hypothetical protein [Pseudoalteromonas luteoviolacea]|uniref:Uncharacterized protein n=1 Tax=Pseudoalteromonas luteoviolacea DSM 6061 TaxID=1365250 RepID=A0A166UCG1_9GAMM|nr:hypothetical protein [Pseudoalteromonas luteoviolacea]KZN29794.1 hypothetical protein N475_05715 [Pseudoalteromonas luteoviolacea DSM 6061]KZN55095.1 hypothetical protein N474_16620 [Pseudoalteromonas luteoviolacea CPMOR-2]MBE0389304.1 hypothetical protein [Pseudoalteromonas luteoviolacea DSM 6061]TQF68000.1 hypothetical protein FLM44_22790 [Pseudoalteromonas luteoviolacea]